MIFAHDTEEALVSAAALINTAPINTSDGSSDKLSTLHDLDVFVLEQRFSGSRAHDEMELRGVRRMRTQLRAIWVADEATAARLVNELLAQAKALPQLVKHDQWDWHLHATTSIAPLAQRMGTEAAMGLVDVIRSKELARLKVCAADDCQAVLIDLSKNRSRRYCDTGNCGNRAHVAAYRARKAAEGAN